MTILTQTKHHKKKKKGNQKNQNISNIKYIIKKINIL